MTHVDCGRDGWAHLVGVIDCCDNGSIFQSRRFRAACHDYRLTQEFITPYTPEQNGI